MTTDAPRANRGVVFDAAVAVVGVGSVGSMALWQLAGRGVSAVGFEQFAPGHDRGAAGGESRVFRLVYRAGAAYIPLLLSARQEWRRLEETASAGLLDQCGYLEIASSEDEGFQTTLSEIAEHRLDHVVLDAASAQRRFPQHRFRDNDIAVLDRFGGSLRPEYAVMSAARRAEALGARVLRRCRVERLVPDDRGVTIYAGSRRWRFGCAVVTAGSWVAELLPELGGTVVPRRLPLTWFPAIEPEQFSPSVFPSFGRSIDGDFVYGVPTVDGRSVKVATLRLDDQAPVDPDHLDPEVPAAVLERLRSIVGDYLPGLVPDPVRSAVFADGYTPDGHGLVGLHPEQQNLVLVGGLSGHGFKLAPLLGKVAADLAIDRTTAEAVGFLDPGRFDLNGGGARTCANQ